jgi:hypothetical protein
MSELSRLLNVLDVSFYKVRSCSGVDFSGMQSGTILSLRRRNTPEFAERVVTGLNDGEEPHVLQIGIANPLVANELWILGWTVASAEASLRLEIIR